MGRRRKGSLTLDHLQLPFCEINALLSNSDLIILARLMGSNLLLSQDMVSADVPCRAAQIHICVLMSKLHW